MTKEELKAKLKEHEFGSLNEFLDMVEAYQKTPPAVRCDILKEEYDAAKKGEE